MAQDVQGMLIRIEATTAQLRKELAAADRAVSGSSSKIDKELGLVDKAFARMGLNAEQSRKAIGAAMAGITAAAAGGVAGLGALVVSTANSAREIQNLSQVANASTTEFQRYAVGAKTVGIEQDKLADILKDVNDRVGDFLSTGGGEMKDFFEQIAPRVGVTAEQFRKLSGPQALQLFYNSLEKANLSQAEMTFYMEAMANDTTALIPLLRDGGAGFSAMADEAERLGLVMSEKTLKQFDQFNAQMDTAKMAAGGFGTQIATEALPALSELNGLLIDFAQDSEAASVVGDALGIVLKGVATVAIGLSTTFANLGRAIGGLAAAASAAASMEFSQASSIIDQFTADNEAATAQAEQRIKKLWTGEYADAGKRAVEVNRTVSESSIQLGAAAKKSADDQKKAIDEKLKSLDALVAKYDPAAKAQAAYDAGIKLADEALKNNTYTTEQYQKVVQGLYTDLNKPIWDKHNKQADEAAAAIKKIDDQLESVRDRLDPVRAATKRLTAEKDLLKEALDKGRISFEDYTQSVALLDKEYEENTRATSEWAKWTEGALDRVDSAFADAWRNIGDGFSSFRDSLTNAFKQMLAELAHMAITKPIMVSFGNAIMGTNKSGGIGEVWGSLFGGSSGSSGSGGLNIGSILQYGQSAYSALTGVGPAALAGWQAGGLGGALGGVGSYYGGMLGGAASTVGGWLGLGGASAASGAAAGTGFGLGGSLVSGGVGSATYAASAGGIGSAISSALSSMASMWWLAPIIGAWQSGKLYDKGVRPDAKETWSQGGHTALGKIGNVAPTFQSKFFELLDSGLQKASFGLVDGKIAAMLSGSTFHQALWGGISKKLFGGAWETKDGGIALGATDGDLSAQQYIYQKKKGGLFSSSKKRTRYSALDDETLAALQETYDATEAGVASLFESLSLTVEEGSLAGLQLAREKISTKGKTEEQISEAINAWFLSAGDAMSRELNKVLGTGLDFDLASMQSFVGNLYGVNAALEQINVDLLETTVQGGHFSEALIALTGGLAGLQSATATYYQNFFTEAEKTADTVEAIKEAFADADVTLADSRESYRAMVEDIDVTTEAGREMFASLMGLAGQAATYYTIVEQQAAEALAKAQADEAQAAAVEQERIAGILGAVSNAFTQVQRSIAAEQQALNAEISATTGNISALASVGNSLDAAIKRLRGSSDDTVRSLRAQAVMTLNSALVTARSGGSLAQFAGLQDALDVASEMDTALYGSLQDFEREQGRTANIIAELEKVNGKQLTAEERMLEQYEEQSAQLDEQLAFAQDQLDALNGIDTSVLSVADAVAAMNSAVVTALGVLANGLAPHNTAGNNATLVDSVYKDLFGRDPDAAGSQFWQGQLKDGKANYADLADQMLGGAKGGDVSAAINQAYQKALGRNADAAGAAWYASQIASGAIRASDLEKIIKGGAIGSDVPGFASGGFHSGGLRLVGENGPELEVTGPSRIYNASQTAAMLGGGDSTAAIASLQRTVEGQSAALRSIAKHTMQTAKRVEFLERWDFDGLPKERDVA